MSQKVDEIRIATLRDLIETERERLKSLRKTDRDWWDSESSSDWARREFGKDLDGGINDETLRCQMEICQICGKEMALDDKFVCLKFSFCDEYNCKMNICKSCLGKLVNRLK